MCPRDESQLQRRIVHGWTRDCRPLRSGDAEYQLEAVSVDDDVAAFRVERDNSWGDWNRNRLWATDRPCTNPGDCVWKIRDPNTLNGAPFSLTVGNKGCLKSNATFTVTHGGRIEREPKTFSFGGFNHCGYQVDYRLQITPSGKVDQLLWKRIP